MSLPTTMTAARFDAGTMQLELQHVPVPTLAAHEVLVRVAACGICLSDVHLLDGTLPSSLPAVTPGHEAAGVVVAVGDNVAYWKAGSRVVMAGGKPCLTCDTCGRGRYESCPNIAVMGFGYDGAWAEYVAVPAMVLTEIPEWLPFEQAAILADAVSTRTPVSSDAPSWLPRKASGCGGSAGSACTPSRSPRWSVRASSSPSTRSRRRGTGRLKSVLTTRSTRRSRAWPSGSWS